ASNNRYLPRKYLRSLSLRSPGLVECSPILAGRVGHIACLRSGGAAANNPAPVKPPYVERARCFPDRSADARGTYGRFAAFDPAITISKEGSGQLAVARFRDPDPHDRGEQERRAPDGECREEAARRRQRTERERRGGARDPAHVVADAGRGRAHGCGIQLGDHGAETGPVAAP